MAKKKIHVEFWQKVKYFAEIEVTNEQLELLQEHDGSYVKKHHRINGQLESNPAYEILQEYAIESNECDWGDEVDDFEIMSDL